MIRRVIRNQSMRLFATLFIFRVIVFLFGILLFILLENPASQSPYALSYSTWARWDTRWYLSIATEGYQGTSDTAPYLVFFPVYPLLIFLASHFATLQPFTIGLLISWAAFAAAGVVVYKLVLLDHSREVAQRTVKYLALFPFTFFFGMAYTESLFLLVVVSTLFALRTNRWYLTALLLFIAGMTRLQGILLLIPILIEIFSSWYRLPTANRKTHFLSMLMGVGVFALTGAFSVFCYLALNKVISENWLQFLAYQQQNWHYAYMHVFSSISQLIRSSVSETNVLLQIGTWIPQVLMFFTSVALLVLGFRSKVRKSYLAYWLAHLVVSFSSSWLLSGVRFMLPMFMLYLVLALIAKNRRVDAVFTSVMVLSLACSIWLFLKNVVL